MVARKQLPLTRRFSSFVAVYIYPSPQGGRGDIIRGRGQVTLVFEPTQKPDIARVRIEDIQVKFLPARVAFDIDRDGLLECFDLNDWHIGVEAFDLKRSGGEYNLQDKSIMLTYHFTVVPQMLVSQSQVLDSTPLRIELKVRGWMDLETGDLQTYTDRWTVPEGPLAGLTFWEGCGPSGSLNVCELNFGVYLADAPSSPSDSELAAMAAQAEKIPMPDTVWKCPSMDIILAWYSNADHVIIAPKILGQERFPSGAGTNVGIVQIVSGIARDMIYMAKVGGEGETSCTDTDECDVHINIISDSNNEIDLQADFDPGLQQWTKELYAYQYDSSAIVEAITIDSYPGCVDCPQWQFDYIPTLNEAHPYSQTIDTGNLLHIPLDQQFPLPGVYIFTPHGDNVAPAYKQQQFPVCFRLRVHGC